MLYHLDLFGTAIFAITGSLVAREKQLDLFGVVVIAIVTSIGGGTLRDVLLGATPVFWITNTAYIIVASSAALATFAFIRFYTPPRRILLVADAFGLAIFTVIGTQTALDRDVSTLIAVIMGMMTGVAGGIVRDLLSDEIPLILRRDIYATASLSGAIVFAALSSTALPDEFVTLCGVITTLGLRLAAIRWGWALPLMTDMLDQTTKK